MSEGPPAFQSLTFSPPHTAAAHTTSWTIQPVVFVLDPPSVALSHSQPSLSLCAITLLSLLHIALIFLFSCFEKSDILYLFYRNISDYPPAHLFFTFSFSFGLLLKICPNIFDVYFRLKLEKIFSLGFSFCLFFFSGWGGLMVEKQRQQSGWLGIRRQQSAPSRLYFNTVLHGGHKRALWIPVVSHQSSQSKHHQQQQQQFLVTLSSKTPVSDSE